jgi:heme-degrading monooxygenase HmoA
MIVCIIEFGVRPGMDPVRTRLLTELFAELETFDGFQGKETFEDCDKPGRKITISYWTDAEALGRWMKDRAHLRAIGIGKQEVFTHYQIRIATVDKETNWRRPDAPAA